MKEKCFVIQQFDEKNNARYKSTIKPAIEDADFEAYRVDQDKSVQIPIESIEKNIRDSDVCIADISDNNANVWFEVGFAAALGKYLILLCSDKIEEKDYPFDVRHRNIISYTAGTSQGHTGLKREIIKRLKAYKEKNNTNKQ